MARARATIDRDGSTEHLVELGLTLNEARCYLALLEAAPATAAELAEASGVPRPKVYATLKTLEQRGFCYPSGDRVTRFRPVDPELALGELSRAREHERRLADERDRQLTVDLVRGLPAPPEELPEDTREFMQHTGSPGSTIEIFERMIETTERRVDIVHGVPVFQEPANWNRFEVAVLGHGVQVRVLFPTLEMAGEHRYEELVEAGGEVRVARGTPLKLLLRDGTEALVALREPRDEMHPTCVLIRHPDLVAPLQLMFSREWRRARSIEPVRAEPAESPPAR